MIAFWLLLAGVSAYCGAYAVYLIKLRRALPAAGALLLAVLPIGLGALLYIAA